MTEVEEFIRNKGVTQCPPAYCDASTGTLPPEAVEALASRPVVGPGDWKSQSAATRASQRKSRALKAAKDKEGVVVGGVLIPATRSPTLVKSVPVKAPRKQLRPTVAATPVDDDVAAAVMAWNETAATAAFARVDYVTVHLRKRLKRLLAEAGGLETLKTRILPVLASPSYLKEFGGAGAWRPTLGWLVGSSDLTWRRIASEYSLHLGAGDAGQVATHPPTCALTSIREYLATHLANPATDAWPDVMTSSEVLARIEEAKAAGGIGAEEKHNTYALARHLVNASAVRLFGGPVRDMDGKVCSVWAVRRGKEIAELPRAEQMALWAKAPKSALKPSDDGAGARSVGDAQRAIWADIIESLDAARRPAMEEMIRSVVQPMLEDHAKQMKAWTMLAISHAVSVRQPPPATGNPLLRLLGRVLRRGAAKKQSG